MIKKIVTISLAIFVLVVVVILGVSVFTNQKRLDMQINNSSSNNNPLSITSDQVAQHNSVNDCWLIINNKVYNVTSYINLHPTGPESIISQCGKDATIAFNTKGGKGSHSQKAQDALINYYVGNFIR